MKVMMSGYFGKFETPPQSARGMTLVELILSITILVILVTLAVPSMTEIVQNNRGDTQINDLQSSLNYARSEAIKRNASVSLCHTHDGETCHLGKNWKPGLIVFEDQNLNGTIDEGDTVLRLYRGLSGGNKLKFSANKIVYSSNGFATTGTFTLCDTRGATHSRGLIIGSGGLATAAVDGDSNGIPEDHLDVNLSCS